MVDALVAAGRVVGRVPQRVRQAHRHRRPHANLRVARVAVRVAVRVVVARGARHAGHLQRTGRARAAVLPVVADRHHRVVRVRDARQPATDLVGVSHLVVGVAEHLPVALGDAREQPIRVAVADRVAARARRLSAQVLKIPTRVVAERDLPSIRVRRAQGTVDGLCHRVALLVLAHRLGHTLPRVGDRVAARIHVLGERRCAHAEDPLRAAGLLQHAHLVRPRETQLHGPLAVHILESFQVLRTGALAGSGEHLHPTVEADLEAAVSRTGVEVDQVGRPAEAEHAESLEAALIGAAQVDRHQPRQEDVRLDERQVAARVVHAHRGGHHPAADHHLRTRAGEHLRAGQRHQQG